MNDCAEISSKKSQKEAILRHMQEYGNITPMDALRLYKCFRLSARIKELEYDGYLIHHDLITIGGIKYAVYTLIICDKNDQLRFL